MAALYDIYIQQGSDFVQIIDITGDYTGQVIRGKVVDPVGLKEENIVAWEDASVGRFKITIPNSVTSFFTNGLGYYDIEIDNNGMIDKIMSGRAYIDKEV